MTTASPHLTPLPPPAQLRAELLAWYERSRRALPWRALPEATAEPWAVLVSEIMLQQTTVATVRGRYRPFLDRFPTPAAMAAAPVEDVLQAWAGLGYYRRARALHACAVALARDHRGRVPGDLAALRALPGLGAYTSAAVAAIGFGLPAVPVDANVARVLARLHGVARPSVATLEHHAAALATTERAGDLAQALMELGALVCAPRRPACLACPWRAACRAAASGAPEAFPLPVRKPERARRWATSFLLRRADGAVLVRRRPPDGPLGGMPELPGTPWGTAPATEREIAAAAPVAAAWRPVPGSVRHLFTHLDLEVTLLRAETTADADGLWVAPERLVALGLPTLTLKLVRHAGLLGPGAARGRPAAERRRGRASATATG